MLCASGVGSKPSGNHGMTEWFDQEWGVRSGLRPPVALKLDEAGCKEELLCRPSARHLEQPATAFRRAILKALVFPFNFLWFYSKEQFNRAEREARGAGEPTWFSTFMKRVAGNSQDLRALGGYSARTLYRPPSVSGWKSGESLYVSSKNSSNKKAVKGRFMAPFLSMCSAFQVVVYSMKYTLSVHVAFFASQWAYLPTKYVAGSVCHSERASPLSHPVYSLAGESFKIICFIPVEL